MSRDQRGMQGDHGQDGRDGVDGLVGPRGRRGGLSWLQGLVLFVLVMGTFIFLAYRLETAQNRIESQQAEIAVNSAKIQAAQQLSCESGRRILSGFNDQQDTLAAIEQSLADDPDSTPVGQKIARKRVEAYKNARILPLPICTRPR